MGISDMVRARLLELCRQRGVSVNKMCEWAAVPQSTVNITEFFDTDAFRNLEQEIH